MKGQKCRCGFATVSQRPRCPRCGKLMKPSEWPDEGKVLSFTELHTIPEGSVDPYNLALVGLHKGPKVVCWASGILSVEDKVAIQERNGRYFCEMRTEADLKTDADRLKA